MIRNEGRPCSTPHAASSDAYSQYTRARAPCSRALWPHDRRPQERRMTRPRHIAKRLCRALTGYPAFVEGDRRRPPEDIGGPDGFMDFLEAILDPVHETHGAKLDWYGGLLDSSGLDETRHVSAWETWRGGGAVRSPGTGGDRDLRSDKHCSSSNATYPSALAGCIVPNRAAGRTGRRPVGAQHVGRRGPGHNRPRHRAAGDPPFRALEVGRHGQPPLGTAAGPQERRRTVRSCLMPMSSTDRASAMVCRATTR